MMDAWPTSAFTGSTRTWPLPSVGSFEVYRPRSEPLAPRSAVSDLVDDTHSHPAGLEGVLRRRRCRSRGLLVSRAVQRPAAGAAILEHQQSLQLALEPEPVRRGRAWHHSKGLDDATRLLQVSRHQSSGERPRLRSGERSVGSGSLSPVDERHILGDAPAPAAPSHHPRLLSAFSRVKRPTGAPSVRLCRRRLGALDDMRGWVGFMVGGQLLVGLGAAAYVLNEPSERADYARRGFVRVESPVALLSRHKLGRDKWYLELRPNGLAAWYAMPCHLHGGISSSLPEGSRTEWRAPTEPAPRCRTPITTAAAPALGAVRLVRGNKREKGELHSATRPFRCSRVRCAPGPIGGPKRRSFSRRARSSAGGTAR